MTENGHSFEPLAPQEPKPLLVRSGKAFSIDPNVDLSQTSEFVRDAGILMDDGEVVDIIDFSVENEAINGSISVISLNMFYDSFTIPIRRPAGLVNPIAFEVDILNISKAQEETEAVQVMMEYDDQRFFGDMDYSLSDDEHIEAWTNGWVDDDTGENVHVAFPPDAAKGVRFTIFTRLEDSIAD